MIGIFDSGSGGLTVLRALRARAPQADVVYLGDLANAPYGNRSREELGELTVGGIRSLIDLGATEIISACNSMSVSLVLSMFDMFDMPRTSIIEMVGPAVASFRGEKGRVLVLATKATVDSGVYQNGFRTIGVNADALALPELVAHIEADAPAELMEEYIEQSLAHVNLDSYTHVLLCCTHYPLVRNCFENVVRAHGSHASIVDPADAVAARAIETFSVDGTGRVAVYTTRASEVFARRVGALMGGHPYTLDFL